MIPIIPKRYLELHTGNKFSIAWNGNHIMKWKDTKYISYDPRINMCQLNHNELIFEGDYKDKRLNDLLLEQLEIILTKAGIYYMRTCHKSKSDYIWIVLTTKDNRIITEQERIALINYFSEQLGMIRYFDKALAYYKGFVRPVPNAIHWKNNNIVEVVKVCGSKPLNIDLLPMLIKQPSSKINISHGGNRIKSPIGDLKPNTWYNKVVSKVKLSDIAQEYLGSVCCPHCSREDNYFSYNDTEGLFFCFDCHKKGNLVEFTRLMLERKREVIA